MTLDKLFSDTGKGPRVEAYSQVPVNVDNTWRLTYHALLNQQYGYRLALSPQEDFRSASRPLFLGKEHNSRNPEFFLLATYVFSDGESNERAFTFYTGRAPILNAAELIDSGFVNEEIPELKTMDTLGKVIPGYKTGKDKMFKISFRPRDALGHVNRDKTYELYVLGSVKEPARVLDGDPGRFTQIVDTLFFDLA
jgi:hypothetical protein